MNTLQKGSVRYIVFKDRQSWYAVGLEFNIVENGSSPEEARLLLFEALQGYVEAVRKAKLRPIVLNQKVDRTYEKMWFSSIERRCNVNNKIYTVGVFNLNKNRVSSIT